MANDRRVFIGALASAGVFGAGNTLRSTNVAWAEADEASGSESQRSEKGAEGRARAVTLPKLPYAYDALEPVIDAQTMQLHHSRHHQAYVDGMELAEQKLEQARSRSSFDEVDYWTKKWTFNAGGHFLHSLFWQTMRPVAEREAPSQWLTEKFERNFQSVKAFREQLVAAATQVEGAGWGLLLYDSQRDRLFVGQAENQQKLSSWGAIPVLGVDVWEHAYYLKYQNRRREYVEAWLQVVHWPSVEKNIRSLAVAT